ncbi:TorF family putative porin [Oligoflexus tunisiensis]|uniref:TorF family putative porin n=1 Tax=Oligoflexus tunisiensis TaxID=708132 RepID=UPI00114CFAE7|nr:TorF family putative porin [Oligoflexus tunisiensis]
MLHARITLGFLALTALPAWAVDMERLAPGRDLSATAGVDLASAYIFRGTTVNKNPVLQPLLKVQSGGLTLGGWGNRALDAENGELEQEVDAFASFDLPLDALLLSVGYTEYMYPESDFDNDQEVMLRITLPTLLNPTLAAFRGVGGGILDTNYYELGLKEEIFARYGITGSFGGTLAYLDRETGEDGLSHLTLTAGAAWQVVAASVNYVVETDEDVNDLDEQEQLYVTTGASFTF